MIHFLCFLVLAVAIQSPAAWSNKFEQSERWVADLAQAEDSLSRATQLFSNCEGKNGSSNLYECSKKEKSIAYIGVALDLVSNAKKSIPICPPTDCQELQAAGTVTSGVYTVWPGGLKSVRVRCDMDTEGGGWTVIQRRGNFTQQENFDREWLDYKTGFGSLERDFWIGNDNIFLLTNQGAYSLRMDMTAVDGKKAYALFRLFRIENENSNYRLHVNKYEGTAGTSMYSSNSYTFSTKDRSNNIGRNCSDEMKGGFWYKNCAKCNPNGLYRPGVEDLTSMHYFGFKKFVGLSSIDMKIMRLGRISNASEA